jgi:glycine/D-amino acid oxidase-like deaminating enzyme
LLSALIIVGQGLAGTLAALEAETRGLEFTVVDRGSGAQASRAAAGLFNPLTGPRFSADSSGWDRLLPSYRELERRLGVRFVHPLPLLRPWAGAKVGPESFPRSAPGWTAAAGPDGVRIEGGGWIDIPALLDAARRRWRSSGRLEERDFDPEEGRGRRVLWCGGLTDFTGPVWGPVPGVNGRWQGVRGDLLTVKIPGLDLLYGEVGPRFLLPLGGELYRWGATHESDVTDQGRRPQARALLETELAERLGSRTFQVLDHSWGVRPASRTKAPLVLNHPQEEGWRLFNGFGGRGVALVPRWLDRLEW